MAADSHYDKEKADKAVNFMQKLCHTKGKWFKKPFALLPWQEQIIRDIYGIVKPDGKRQFTTAYIEIPKKQGKSELAAAVALKQLAADGEQRAEVYGCAADTNQASIVFDVAKDMVNLCPALKKRIKFNISKFFSYKPLMIASILFAAFVPFTGFVVVKPLLGIVMFVYIVYFSVKRCKSKKFLLFNAILLGICVTFAVN